MASGLHYIEVMDLQLHPRHRSKAARSGRTLAAIVFLLAWAVLPPLPAQAGNANRARNQARRAYQHALVAQLAKRHDAGDLLAAALLARTELDEGGPLGFRHLVRRAARAPRAGPAAHWIRLSACDAQAGNCPNPAALKALLLEAPDNAAVWMLRMGQAAADDDKKAAYAALRKAAGARLYDDYTGRSLQVLADAVQNLAPPPAALTGPGGPSAQAARLRVLIVFGTGDAQPMPGFHLLAAQCRPADTGSAPARRALCLRLARVLARGGSPLARSLGLHLLATLAPDPSVRRRARQGMADLVWQVRQFDRVQLLARRSGTAARRLLALARRGGTEMALTLAALHAFGIASSPPSAVPGLAPEKERAPSEPGRL